MATGRAQQASCYLVITPPSTWRPPTIAAMALTNLPCYLPYPVAWAVCLMLPYPAIYHPRRPRTTT
eukprot:scaffold106389_cov34-Phaeocystis_antarctica.AAC.1